MESSVGIYMWLWLCHRFGGTCVLEIVRLFGDGLTTAVLCAVVCEVCSIDDLFTFESRRQCTQVSCVLLFCSRVEWFSCFLLSPCAPFTSISLRALSLGRGAIMQQRRMLGNTSCTLSQRSNTQQRGNRMWETRPHRHVP